MYVNRGGVSSGRRRNVVALAMLVGAIILAVPFTTNMTMLLIVFSVTLTGIASTTSLNFALLNDLLPSAKNVGKAMAFVVVGGNIFGMVAPIATGYVIAATGSYDWAFGIAGILLLGGATITLTMIRRPMLAKTSAGVPMVGSGVAQDLERTVNTNPLQTSCRASAFIHVADTGIQGLLPEARNPLRATSMTWACSMMDLVGFERTSGGNSAAGRCLSLGVHRSMRHWACMPQSWTAVDMAAAAGHPAWAPASGG